MRDRPFAFLRLGNRWVNMALVSDVVDEGQQLTLFLVAESARLAGAESPTPVDVARQFTVSRPEDVVKLRKWLKLNDEE